MDGNGNLMIAVTWCGQPPDGVTIFYRDPSNVKDSGPAHPSYGAPKLGGNFATVSLLDPQDGWSLRTDAVHLDPRIEYTAHGWTRNNKHSTAHVTFRTSVATKLKEGQVFFQDAAKGWVDTISSQEEFVKISASLCD